MLRRLRIRSLRQAARAGHANQLADESPPPDPAPAREAHISTLMDGEIHADIRLDPTGGAILTTALRIAEDAWDPKDPRKPAERKADALVGILQFFLDHHNNNTANRHRPHLNIVIDLADLATGSARTISGITLDRPTTQSLLCDTNIHRVITGGPSTILDYGRSTRTISPALWTALVLRDQHCRHPGCDRPSTWCQAHHVTPWTDHGGETNLANLVLTCSRHHHIAHRNNWHGTLHPDATYTLTTPTGITLTSRPPPKPHPIPTR